MIAGRLANLGVGRPQENVGNLPLYSLQHAADLLRVSKKSVQRAKRILDDAHPEIIDAVDAGTMKLNAAAMLAMEPVNVQSNHYWKSEDRMRGRGFAREVASEKVERFVRRVKEPRLGIY